MVFVVYDYVKFYGLINFIDWQYFSDWGQFYGEYGGVWECLDFFLIIVIDSGEKKWVLFQSLNFGGFNGGLVIQYFIGDFDGKEFSFVFSFEVLVIDGKVVWFDYGCDNYVGVIWLDVLVEDGCWIFMGWMSNWDYVIVVLIEYWCSVMIIVWKLILWKIWNGY